MIRSCCSHNKRILTIHSLLGSVLVRGREMELFCIPQHWPQHRARSLQGGCCKIGRPPRTLFNIKGRSYFATFTTVAVENSTARFTSVITAFPATLIVTSLLGVKCGTAKVPEKCSRSRLITRAGFTSLIPFQGCPVSWWWQNSSEIQIKTTFQIDFKMILNFHYSNKYIYNRITSVL